jgi:putative ABC transport system permease protein
MSRVASIRPNDLASLAWSSLRRNRLRSTLTIGGIAVGIGVMMFLITLGLGLEQITIGSVQRSSALLALTISSPNQDILPLGPKAVTAIQKIPGIQGVFPQVTVDGQVGLGTTIAPGVTIVGADPGSLEIDRDTKLLVGRYYRPEDINTMVVTSEFLKQFGLDANRTPLVSFTVTLNPVNYPNAKTITDVSISGVVDASSPIIYLPRPFLEAQLGLAQPPPYTTMQATAQSLDQVAQVAEGIRALGYKVSSVIDTVDQIRKVFAWVQWVLGSLGAIAIMVATIGMFNTLTISLLERTKEIGIMKALGVKRGDISRLFLLEALFMGLLGGFLGVGFAFLLQELTIFSLQLLATLKDGTVPKLFANEPIILIGFVIFATIIALLTGIYPSQRAMRLNPIEAIRYE